MIIVDFLQGCVDEIKKYAKDHMLIIGGIAVGVGAIQVGSLFLSLFFITENPPFLFLTRSQKSMPYELVLSVVTIIIIIIIIIFCVLLLLTILYC